MIRHESGEEAELEATLMRVIPRVQRAVAFAVGGDAEAGDLVNTCVAEIIKALHGFRGTGSLQAWADQVTFRVLMRQLKRRRRRERTVGLRAEIEELSAGNPETAVSHAAISHVLQDALAGLVKERRLTLILRIVLGHSVAEVAEIMGVGIHTVRARIRAGLKDLRTRLAEDPVVLEVLAGAYDDEHR